MSVRQVSTLPLPRSTVELLNKNGIYHVSELEEMNALQLSIELNVTVEAAETILEVLSPLYASAPVSANATSLSDAGSSSSSSSNMTNPSSGATTAREGAAKAQSLKPIITFSKSVDTMLGGGFPLGQVTEICGLPGAGKTQMATQLALDVQIPKVFGGNEGEALYVDTEGNFYPERALEMATALAEHLKKLAAAKMNPNVGESDEKTRERAWEKQQSAARCSALNLLGGIRIYRAHGQTELLATINLLPSVLQAHPKVKLVVIDSMAFLFRIAAKEDHLRVRLLAQVAQKLNELAHRGGLAVVVVNHMTHNYATSNGSSRSTSLQPVLGEQWGHSVTNRLLLAVDDKAQGTRKATLVKCPSRPLGTAVFRILQIGVRDAGKDGEGGKRPAAAAAAGGGSDAHKHLRRHETV
jgi:RAD51-like protein 2